MFNLNFVYIYKPVLMPARQWANISCKFGLVIGHFTSVGVGMYNVKTQCRIPDCDVQNSVVYDIM